jgi:transposase
LAVASSARQWRRAADPREGRECSVIIVGVDAHEATHSLVAIDAGGRKIGQKTVPATTDSHLRALKWVRATFGSEITWGVEDVRNVSARLERDLIDAGVQVVRVPTRMMSRVRSSARVIGKSDPIDALAVAHAVLREPTLPVATHDPLSRRCKLLVDRRDVIVEHRTATVHRLMWRLHELDPSHKIVAQRLYVEANRVRLHRWLNAQRDSLVADLACEELADIGYLTQVAVGLERKIKAMIPTAGPSLLEIRGCGPLLAAKILGETADVNRFGSEDAFARYAGVGPVPRWSGRSEGRMRHIRTGNRSIWPSTESR